MNQTSTHHRFKLLHDAGPVTLHWLCALYMKKSRLHRRGDLCRHEKRLRGFQEGRGTLVDVRESKRDEVDRSRQDVPQEARASAGLLFGSDRQHARTSTSAQGKVCPISVEPQSIVGTEGCRNLDHDGLGHLKEPLQCGDDFRNIRFDFFVGVLEVLDDSRKGRLFALFSRDVLLHLI